MPSDQSPKVTIREFDAQRDIDDIQRIWQEVDWLDKTPDEYLPDAFAVGRTLVAEFDSAVECSVLTLPGSIRYQSTDLPLNAVAAVTTSRIARRLGLAQQLTSLQLAHAAEQGAAVSALGMFDQGFYNKLGFATASYDQQFTLDPASLDLRVPYRAPKRLQLDDYAVMHKAMVQRLRGHGAVVLAPPLTFKSELGWVEGGFGLGYYGDPDSDNTDELTHFMWLQPKAGHGPYDVKFMAYRSLPQLLELLGVLQSLGDQVYSVIVLEPPELQLQTLLKQPFRHKTVTRHSPHAAKQKATAWWQLRVLDVVQCVAARQWVGPQVQFNLALSDPLTQPLSEAATPWQGCGGSYHICLGQTSYAKPIAEVDARLPTIKCDVGTFTRLLFGIAPATSLAAVENLQGPAPLLAELDDALRLPATLAGWDF